MVDIEKVINDFLSVINDIPALYEQNDNEIIRLDAEYGDLTHLVEFTNFSSVQGFRIVKRIKENRLKRRKCKDENNLIKGINEYIGRSKSIFIDLHKIKTEIRRQKTYMEEQRTYNPRVLDENEFGNLRVVE